MAWRLSPELLSPSPLDFLWINNMSCGPYVVNLASSILCFTHYCSSFRLGLNVTSSVKSSLNTFSKGYLFLLLFISNSSLFPLQELEMWNNFYLFCPSFLLDCFTALKLETHLYWSPLHLEHPSWGQAWHRCSSQLVEWIYEFWEKGSWGFPVGQRTLWLPWG